VKPVVVKKQDRARTCCSYKVEADTNRVKLSEMTANWIHEQLTEHPCWESSNLADAIYTARWRLAAKSYLSASSEVTRKSRAFGACNTIETYALDEAEAQQHLAMLSWMVGGAGRLFARLSHALQAAVDKPRCAPFTLSRSSLTNTE
jgi:hypothetical protein